MYISCMGNTQVHQLLPNFPPHFYLPLQSSAMIATIGGQYQAIRGNQGQPLPYYCYIVKIEKLLKAPAGRSNPVQRGK